MYKLILLSVFSSLVCAEPVNVVTSLGTVIGERHDRYNTFFGVPYAKVDEENPFSSNIDYPRFETPFNANDSTVTCPHPSYDLSSTLQCLRLNIYVPHTANPTNKRPIFVWFHEESTFTNAGQYGGQHLVKKDIIVVTVNYRLGPYGFLCLANPKVTGNQGLKDQITALKWLKKNIADFGGDPSEITIAGGSAIDLHSYSEFNDPQKPLFNKAIIQSGSMFKPGFYVEPDYEAAIKIAQHLGYNVSETEDALKFLAKHDHRAVMLAAKNLTLPMSVCTERGYRGVQKFVNQSPYLFEDVYDVAWTKIMIGYTSMEEIHLYAGKSNDFFNKTGDIFFKTLQKAFDVKKEKLQILSDIIKRFYLGKKSISSESLLELSSFSSDFLIKHSVERSIWKYLNEFATVYKYVFSYTGGSSYKNVKGSGAPHNEELKYLFELGTSISGTEQLTMRERMTTLWANFVKFGNPTPSKTEAIPKWTPVTRSARRYLNIDVDLVMQDQRHEESMALLDLLWLNYQACSVVYEKLVRAVANSLNGVDDDVNCGAWPPVNIS